MYIPAAFHETDRDIVHALMRENDFALLVSATPDGPLATHLPMMLEDDGADGEIAIVGHMAKANPHWRALEADPRAMIVFSGPHAYVSPSWYETGPAVPTWNYAAVHAHGQASLIVEAGALEALVARLVAIHEDGRDQPWRFDSLPDDFKARQIKGIIGFRLAVERLEGKLKLSQNRPAGDAINVAARLASGDSETGRATAALMRRVGIVKT